MFVPVIGYLILFNEHFVEYFYLSEKFVWNDEKIRSGSDVNYRLFFIYFGLSFIGFGSLIFQLFCPSQIKDYLSMALYVESERNMGSPARFQHVRDQIHTEYSRRYKNSALMSKYMHRLITTLSEFGGKKEGAVVLGEKVVEPTEVDNETLKADYFLSNIRHTKIRFIITIMYALGFFMISIPTLDTFVRVFIAMWYHLFI